MTWIVYFLLFHHTNINIRGKFDYRITYFSPLGGIGVAIFFVLSAYGLNKSWKFSGSVCGCGYRSW